MYTRLCLVSTPGLLCDATCAVVAALPNVRLISIASGALTATQVLLDLPFDLVLIDANLAADEVFALLNWLSDHCPGARRVVARVSSAECDHALAFGADAAMRRDELPAKLSAFLTQMQH